MKVKYDLEFEVEDTQDEFVSVDRLIKEFYRHNRKVLRPITFALNPEINDYPLYETDTWLALYYRKFHVTIQKHETSFMGPHAVKLWFRPIPQTKIWLATAQIRAPFFNRKTIKQKLKRILTDRKFWASERSLEEVVKMPTDTIASV